MKYLLTLILVLTWAAAPAQKIDFTDATNVWYVLTYKETPGTYPRFRYVTEKYANGSDTIINNIVYRKLKHYDYYYKQYFTSAYTRYDSTTNKVFVWNKTTTQDMLLYDYELRIGDSFYSAMNFLLNNVYYIVTNIDSVLINNVQHKRFVLQITDTAFVDIMGISYSFIEGVGNLSGAPLDPLSGDRKLVATGELSRQLLCFYNNGTNPVNTLSRCSDTVLNVYNTEFELKADIYPQPAQSSVNIDLTEIATGILEIYTISGQLVIKQNFNQKNHLVVATNKLNAGIYYMNIQTDTQKRYMGKIIVQ